MGVRKLFFGIFVFVSLSTAAHINFTDAEEPVDSLDNTFLLDSEKVDPSPPLPLKLEEKKKLIKADSLDQAPRLTEKDLEENKNVSAGSLNIATRSLLTGVREKKNLSLINLTRPRSFLKALEEKKKKGDKKPNKAVNEGDNVESNTNLTQNAHELNVSTRARHSSSLTSGGNGKSKLFELYSDKSNEAVGDETTDSSGNSSSFEPRSTDSSAPGYLGANQPINYFSYFPPTGYSGAHSPSLQELSMLHSTSSWPFTSFLGGSYEQYPQAALPPEYSHGGLYSGTLYSAMEPQYLHDYASLSQGGHYLPYSSDLTLQPYSQGGSHPSSAYSQQYSSQPDPNLLQHQYLQSEPSSFDSSQLTPSYLQAYSQTHYQPNFIQQQYAQGADHLRARSYQGADHLQARSYQVDPALLSTS